MSVCLAAASCGESSPSSPSGVQTATLSGTVADTTGGTAVANATVTVVDGPDASRAATTNATGAFSLPGLRLGGFRIRVQREGYEELSQSVSLAADMALTVRLPATRLNLNGTWSGTYLDGRSGTIPVPIPAAMVTQNGTAVTITFNAIHQTSATPYMIGTFTGTLSSDRLDAQVAGELRFTLPLGSNCSGSGTFTGTASPSISITSPSLGVQGGCAGSIPNASITLTDRR